MFILVREIRPPADVQLIMIAVRYYSAVFQIVPAPTHHTVRVLGWELEDGVGAGPLSGEAVVFITKGDIITVVITRFLQFTISTVPVQVLVRSQKKGCSIWVSKQ